MHSIVASGMGLARSGWRNGVRKQRVQLLNVQIDFVRQYSVPADSFCTHFLGCSRFREQVDVITIAHGHSGGICTRGALAARTEADVSRYQYPQSAA
jgi:L-ascorbate metabolism protein UlaG (beta-lactamase superfamily)